MSVCLKIRNNEYNPLCDKNALYSRYELVLDKVESREVHLDRTVKELVKLLQMKQAFHKTGTLKYRAGLELSQI